jgi:glucosamine 6-phosphate synthetase-like amidotransferase/phosphosugar isomerase protein
MCGIAGYGLGERSSVDRTLAAQALLAGIAERGADAVGYAVRGPRVPLGVHKQQTGASALLAAVRVAAGVTQALVHVRDYTKGHPSIDANNHPIRHGAVVGIHNGIVVNDDEIMARHGFVRAAPEMTVDSEAIFALVDERPGQPGVLEELHGSMAAAWLDDRDPDTLHLARGIGRPLWVGRGRSELFFASTRHALEVVERTLRIRLNAAVVDEGRVLAVAGGRIVAEHRFRPDRSYRDRSTLPAVRSPYEGRSCLERLAALARGGLAAEVDPARP